MQLFTALLLGFVGSLHCAGMCGPLAVAMPLVGGTLREHVIRRVAYNFGRVATYCFLGLLFGLVGQGLLLAGLQRWTSILLGALLLAGLFLPRRLTLIGPITSVVGRLKAAMAAQFKSPSLSSQGLFGVLNGFLPCGLVYVACAGAVNTGSTLNGIAYMALFGLGTIPMMLGIGLSGRLMPVSFRLKLRRLVPVSVFMLACLLLLRGMALGIPYLSPDLSGKPEACCAP